MKSLYGWIEPVLWFMGATAFTVLAVLPDSASLLVPDGLPLLSERTRVMQHMAMAGAAGLGALAATAALAVARRRPPPLRWLLAAIREVLAAADASWRLAMAQLNWHAGTALALIVAVGCLVRGFYLPAPLSYDEAYTALSYVANGPLDWLRYSEPNNHVLHTILAGLSTAALGHGVLPLRLPALLAGLLCVPLTFVVCRILSGARAGWLGAALASAFPYSVLYGCQARGYSLVALLLLGSVVVAVSYSERPSTGGNLLLATVTSLGLLTIPTFLLPAAGILIWTSCLLLLKGHRASLVVLRFAIPHGVFVGVLTALLYAPVIIVSNGVGCLFSNRFVSPVGLAQFIRQLPVHAFQTLDQAAHGAPRLLLLAMLALALVAIVVSAYMRRWSLLLLVAAAFLGGLSVLLAKRAIPFERTWSFALYLVFVLVDAGYALATAPRLAWQPRVALALCAVIGLGQVLDNPVDGWRGVGEFPEAPVIAEMLSGIVTPHDQVVTCCPLDEPLHYYLWLRGSSGGEGQLHGGDDGRSFFIVRENWCSLRDLTHLPAHRVLGVGGTAVYAWPPLGVQSPAE